MRNESEGIVRYGNGSVCARIRNRFTGTGLAARSLAKLSIVLLMVFSMDSLSYRGSF